MVLERIRMVRDLLNLGHQQGLSAWFPKRRKGRSGPTRAQRRPWLEALEDRLVPATFYVDDNFSGGAIADADLGTAGNQPATFGTDAFKTVSAALAASASADTIIVNSGTYNEAVNLTDTRILRLTGPDVPGALTIGSLAGVAGTTVQIVGSSALIVGDATNTTFSGTISGSGSLTKVGGGTLTLAGANTYTGATTVSSGVLSVATLANGGVASNIGQSGSAATNLVLNGGTLEYTGASVSIDRGVTINNTTGGTLSLANAAANLTLTGVVRSNISSPATLTKTGAGTLTLGGNGDNFFLGLTVNAGQVNLEKDSTGLIHAVGQPLIINSGGTVQLTGSGGDQLVNTATVNGGGTFDLNGRDETVISLTLNGGSVVGSGILTATSTYDVRSGTASAILAGSVGLTKTTTGTVTLSAANTYTGSTAINGGVLSVAILDSGGSPSGIGQSGSAASNLVLNSSTLEYTGGSYVIDRGITVSNTNGGTLSVANAATFLAVTGAVLSSASADATLTKTGAGTLSLGGTGDNAFLNLVVNAGQVDLAKTSGSVHAVGNQLTVNAGSVRLAGTGGNQIFSNATVTVAGGTFDLNGRNEGFTALILSGGSVIGSGTVTATSTCDVRSGTASAVLAGSAGLTKSTSGTVTLSGANTYTGTTTVSAGVLSVATLADGGVASNIGQSGSAAGNLVLNGGTLDYTGASVTIDRGMTINNTNGGTLSLANAAANLTVTGVVQSNVSNAATLTKTGAGTLTLGGNGDNSHLGLTVNAGQVNLAKNSGALVHAVGPPLIINNGTVQLTGTGGDQILSLVTVNGGCSTSMGGTKRSVP